jgi:3-deoxy-D-manno-octulosonic-acid transferase
MSAVGRSLDRIRPRCIVIAETEIWPNLIDVAAGRQIPVILVNGRMSEKSFRRYRRVAGSLGKLLSLYDRFFFKTEEDRERFASFGVEDSRSVVSGDMKFDAPLDERSEGRITELRHRMSIVETDFLVVAGSTRPGEEKQLLAAYRSLKREYPRLRLLLAPRHIERTDEIATLLKGLNEPYIMYGSDRTGEGVILVDKMGILNELYMAADVAFVGGTLVNIGGHNLLEPVWAGTPVLFGPHVGNVQEAADYIIEHRYGAGVTSVDDLARTLVTILDKRLSFETKSETDLKQAATSIAGDYIREKLGYV